MFLLLVGAGAVLAPVARGQSESPDTLRLLVPPQVEGGSILSVREVRRRLPSGPAAPALTEGAAVGILQDLGRILVESGRYEARLELVVDHGGQAVLRVHDGPVARWDTLRVAAPDDPDLPLLARERRGEPFRPRRFEDDLDRWVEAATERGHPFAAARLESLSVIAGLVSAGVRCDPGPRCVVERVVFPGRRSTRETFLRRVARARGGALFRESDWSEAVRRLERTGLFLAVGSPEVELIEDGRVQVAIPVEESRHNRIEGALGYSGKAGTVSGYLDLVLGNLFGAGRRLAARWERPAPSQGLLRLEWWEPYLGPLPAGLRASLEQEDRDSTFSRLTIDGLLEAAVGIDLSAFAGVEYHRSLLGAEPSERVRRVSTVVGGRWDSVRPARWRGERFEASYRSGRSRVRAPDGQTTDYRLDRAAVATSRYQPVGDVVVLRGAASGEILGREDGLPVSDALRFGGAGSVRGYAEESLVARRYAAVQVEFGPAYAGNRAYLFMDGAWFREFAAGRYRDALGFGLGLAAETGDRRMVLDLGLPRGGSPGEARLHLQLETRF